MRQWRLKNKEHTTKYNKTIRAEKHKKRIKELKLEAIKKLGNKCIKCGYDKNYAALDFHHKNMKEKEYAIADLIHDRKVTKLFIELKKCILLCANCHREIHNPNALIV